MKPTISSLHIDDDVIQKWLSMSQTLHAWSRLLKSTQNTVKEETYANHDNIMIEAWEIKSTKAFKIPKNERIQKMLDITPPPLYPVLNTANTDENVNNTSTYFLSHVN